MDKASTAIAGSGGAPACSANGGGNGGANANQQPQQQQQQPLPRPVLQPLARQGRPVLCLNTFATASDDDFRTFLALLQSRYSSAWQQQEGKRLVKELELWRSPDYL